MFRLTMFVHRKRKQAATPNACHRACVEGLESRRYFHFDGGPDVRGLHAEYFDNKDFTAFKMERIDANVNFAWATGSPVPGTISADTFSVRWTGRIIPDYS